VWFVGIIFNLGLFRYEEFKAVDCSKVVAFVQSLQQPDGSFFGDQYGEVDIRFSFCAIAALSLLVRILTNTCSLIIIPLLRRVVRIIVSWMVVYRKSLMQSTLERLQTLFCPVKTLTEDSVLNLDQNLMQG
jgi:hypothetical protein